jgi:hypothetical protein
MKPFMKSNLRLVVPGFVGVLLSVTVMPAAQAQTLSALTTVGKTSADSQKLATPSTAAASAGTAAAIPAVVDPNDLATRDRVAHLTAALKHKWEQAVSTLPSFCQEWQHLLQQREENNLSHLQWHQSQGYQTANYVGYGRILGCKAKESAEGVPLGRVEYEEKDYYLAGKTPAEAKAHPQLMRSTSTLEIFSWEKDRWFY